MILPSLWTAVAGDRPVPDAHDDPGHITWGWKDELLGQNKCYYARILCKRNFFVSLIYSPTSMHFQKTSAILQMTIILRGIRRDVKHCVRKSTMPFSRMDHWIHLQLKRIIHLSGKDGDKLFNKAIDELQKDLRYYP